MGKKYSQLLRTLAQKTTWKLFKNTGVWLYICIVWISSMVVFFQNGLLNVFLVHFIQNRRVVGWVLEPGQVNPQTRPLLRGQASEGRERKWVERWRPLRMTRLGLPMAPVLDRTSPLTQNRSWAKFLLFLCSKTNNSKVKLPIRQVIFFIKKLYKKYIYI